MKYYFMNDELYKGNKKLPAQKTELFYVEKHNYYYFGYDESGNSYVIPEDEIIIEEEK